MGLGKRRQLVYWGAPRRLQEGRSTGAEKDDEDPQVSSEEEEESCRGGECKCVPGATGGLPMGPDWGPQGCWGVGRRMIWKKGDSSSPGLSPSLRPPKALPLGLLGVLWNLDYDPRNLEIRVATKILSLRPIQCRTPISYSTNFIHIPFPPLHQIGQTPSVPSYRNGRWGLLSFSQRKNKKMSCQKLPGIRTRERTGAGREEMDTDKLPLASCAYAL